ncbi:MAG: hypothetical protein WA822_04080, partial [Albidovulum sp.]
YTFTVLNTGNVALTNLTISDSIASVAGTLASLAPGASDTATFTGSYTITQTDIDNGGVENTATVSATAPGGVAGAVQDVSDTGAGSETTNDPDLGEPGDANGTVDDDADPTNDPTVTAISIAPALQLTKSALLDLGANGVPDVGDTITYSFTVTNSGNQPLTNVTVSDPLVTVTGGPLASFAAGATDSTTFTAVYSLTAADLAAGQVVNSATADGFSPSGAPVTDTSDDPSNSANADANGDGEPDDPTVTAFAVGATTALQATKTVSPAQVSRGGTATFTLTFNNTQLTALTGLTLVDNLPSGLVYTPGTAMFNGAATPAPVVTGNSLSWAGVTIAAGATVTITLDARVAGGGGSYVNETYALGSTGVPISGVATATLRVVPEAVFDCGDIIGKVFDDRNMNGYQDGPDGRELKPMTDEERADPKKLEERLIAEAIEPGLPRVRLATVNGTIITTDEYGRYNVPCAELPAKIGSNFTLKLDTRSLPTGYHLTTENPRVIRVMPGTMARLNFGATLGTAVDVDLMGAAFSGSEPSSALQSGVDQLIKKLSVEPSILRLRYYRQSEDLALVKSRLDSVEALIRERWRKAGQYKLTIERQINRVQ